MDNIKYRRIDADRYAILLNGHEIGAVAKSRSVNLTTGEVSRPVWVAHAKAAHPFGVTETPALQATRRGTAAARAVRAYKELCAGQVVELCKIDQTGRELGWW